MIKKLTKKLTKLLQKKPDYDFKTTLEKIKIHCDKTLSSQSTFHGLIRNLEDLKQSLQNYIKGDLHFPSLQMYINNIFETTGNFKYLKNLFRDIKYYNDNLEIEENFKIELNYLITIYASLLEELVNLENNIKTNKLIKTIKNNALGRFSMTSYDIYKEQIPKIETILKNIKKNIAIIQTQYLNNKEKVNPYTLRPIPDKKKSSIQIE